MQASSNASKNNDKDFMEKLEIDDTSNILQSKSSKVFVDGGDDDNQVDIVVRGDDEIPDEETLDPLLELLLDDEKERCCWWCKWSNFFACDGNGVGIRFYDFASQLCFWLTGAYGEGLNFNRDRWEMVEWMNRAPALTKKPYCGVYSWDHQFLVDDEGHNLEVRIYCNKKLKEEMEDDMHRSNDEPKCPVMIYFHGGGYCIGHPSTRNHDSLCRKFARAGMCVVSVDYRLAPEHPFPAAVHDSYYAFKWVKSKAASKILPRGCDPMNKLILCGDSAGATFALVIASLARDHLDSHLKHTVMDNRNIAHLILMYPSLCHIPSTDSSRTLTQGYFISKPVVKFFMSSYLSSSRTDLMQLLEDRRVAPMKVHLSGLPKTTLISADQDPLRDEVFMLSERLEECTHLHYKGTPHGFVSFHFLSEAKEAVADILQDIAYLFPNEHPNLSEALRSEGLDGEDRENNTVDERNEVVA